MSANAHRPLTALTDADRGAFHVWTEPSLYLVSLTDDGHTLTRTPGEGRGAAPGAPGELAPPPDLRVDGDALRPVSTGQCVVGERAISMVAVPTGVPVAADCLGVTEGRTTIVQGIEHLDDPSAEDGETSG